MRETNTGLLDGYMTPAEVAAQLGITPRTLERWHNQRVGPPRVRLGRKVLYRHQAVVEWITKNETVPARIGQRTNRVGRVR